MQEREIEIEPRAQQAQAQSSGVDRAWWSRTLDRGMQIVDLGFWLLYSLILLQIALEALGARDQAGFKRFLDGLTGPFLQPFKGLFNDPSMHNHQIMLSYIAALVVYLLLQAVLKRCVQLIQHHLLSERMPEREHD